MRPAKVACSAGALAGEPLGAFARDLDDAGDDGVRRQRGEHPRPGLLDLHQAQAGQFLHGLVDLGGRDVALAAQRRGVGDAAEHQRHQGFPLVEPEPDAFEAVRIGEAHAPIIYYRE